jgi:WD repeat-containing protein 19
MPKSYENESTFSFWQFGGLFYFSLEDWKIVADYKHRVGIRRIFPEITGSRLVLIDDKSEAFIYSPVSSCSSTTEVS